MRVLTKISLKNFRSFGPRQQVVDLEPITVLVGPNNAGKSSLISAAALVRDAVRFRIEEVLGNAGGADALCHRPGNRSFELGWSTATGEYATEVEFGKSHLTSKKEDLRLAGGGGQPWRTDKDSLFWPNGFSIRREPFAGLSNTFRMADFEHFNAVAQPLAFSRTLRLSIEALRADAPPSENAVLSENGAGLAQVLARWRNSEPEKAAALDDFISKSVLPEIAHVLVFDAPTFSRSKANTPGTKRLGIRQQDGEKFEAPELSDGALSFIALAMYAIDLVPGAVLFIEEPETAIHPTRLPQLVELFRRMVEEKKAQIILATHSPVLLDQFRDEPEVIRVFRRSDDGSEVMKLTDLPELAEALRRQTPGEMLSLGFFELAFSQLKSQ